MSIRNDHKGCEDLLSHELVYIVQWEKLGMERFLAVYATGHLKNGYTLLETKEYELQRSFQEKT